MRTLPSRFFVFGLTSSLIVVLLTAMLLTSIDNSGPMINYISILTVIAGAGILLFLALHYRMQVDEGAATITQLKEQLKEQEWSLREQEARNDYLKTLVDNTPLLIHVKDLNGRYIFINKQFEKIVGRSWEEIQGKNSFTLFPPAVAQIMHDQDQAVLQYQKPMEFEQTVDLPAGRFTFLTTKFPLRNSRGDIHAVGGVSTDITRRKETEKRLAEEQERLAFTLDSIADGVICFDSHGRVTLFNRVASRLTGYSLDQGLGQPVAKLLPLICSKNRVKSRQLRSKLFAPDRPTHLHRGLLVKPDGTRVPVTVSSAPIRGDNSDHHGVVLVFSEITARIKSEEDRLKIRKLESVGILAGGIAHDYNNVLTAILGNIEMAALELDANHQAAVHLREAEQATMRAVDMTRQFLIFARGGDPVLAPVDPEPIIRSSVETVLVNFENIDVHFSFPEDCWLIRADGGLFSQVIQNMVRNSCEAMPKGGTITLTCSNEAESIPEAEVNHLFCGPQVKIEITDQGEGIAPEHLDKIYDPYFTTREQGQGLGLAIAHSIVRKHGGAIMVHSEVGRGTTFFLYMPAASDLENETTEVQEPVQNNGRILVMDDEKIVRDICGHMLDHLGFQAILVESGEEAVEQFTQMEQSGKPVDLAILDLTIPGGLGGLEAGKKILAAHPEAKLVLASGYAQDPVLTEYQKYGFKGAISKPFKLEQLRHLLHKILAKKG